MLSSSSSSKVVHGRAGFFCIFVVSFLILMRLEDMHAVGCMYVCMYYMRSLEGTVRSPMVQVNDG